MAFCLSVRWPNGTYLGHRSDGGNEPVPTFARAFSALVHAGGTGSLAAASPKEAAPGFAHLTPQTVSALQWFEQHEPIGMEIPGYPDHIPALYHDTEGFRSEGVFLKEGKRTVYKKTSRRVGEASWISAPVRWFWDDEPPAEVAEHIDALCADVAVLGEADSPAILEVAHPQDSDARTHDLVKVSYFDKVLGDDVEVPTQGRLQSLEDQFSLANPAKRPSVSQDKPTLGQGGLPGSEAPTRDGLVTRRLVSRTTETAKVPWELAVVLPVAKGPRVTDEDRVTVAVALHRALIARIGQSCPPVVTGKYGATAQPPANRVALHYLPAGKPVREADPRVAHFVVLIPHGIAPEDADMIHAGLARMRELRTRLGVFQLDAPSVLAGDEFWDDVPQGRVREWETLPAAIPERLVKAAGPDQVLLETVAWSLGNVLREVADDRPGSTSADRLAWMRANDAAITEVSSLWVSDPRAFVHRTKRAIPVMPYYARVSLGDLVPDTAVLALGQSRHLGGGLLVPADRIAGSAAHHG